MNKIYLNQYFSIVLSLVLVVLFANSAYLTFILFDLGVKNPTAWEDTGFQIKFFETIFQAIVFVFAAIYFAVMTILKFPVIEYGKESKSRKLDLEESEEK